MKSGLKNTGRPNSKQSGHPSAEKQEDTTPPDAPPQTTSEPTTDPFRDITLSTLPGVGNDEKREMAWLVSQQLDSVPPLSREIVSSRLRGMTEDQTAELTCTSVDEVKRTFDETLRALYRVRQPHSTLDN